MTENRPTHRVRQAEDRTLSMQKDRAERSGGWHGSQKSGAQNLESEVRAQEAKAEQADEGMQAARQEGMKLPLIFVGAFVYAFGMNYFLQPLHLYAGGMMGYAQLINTLLNMAGITFGGVKIYGILYYIMNVPAMILCYRRLRHRFVFKTVFAVTCITIFMQLIPIPAEPVLEDRLAECMIAGIICGAGIGVILRMGACDGGMNLFGMVIASEKQGASIGKVALLSNIVLYGFCFFIFDIPTVIYSLIYSVFNSLACDKIHTQNINSQILVVTKLKDTKPMEVNVMGRLHRGMTEIDASGVFTGEDVKIFVIFVSKYEVNRLRSIIHLYDPKAFIVENEGVNIDGNFNKRLT
jgi:uncharacterized membrane-anchored protein YitT (DUF2179 family)